MTADHAFTGPLFIIGAGRSGTTMFREILNTNDEICIPMREFSELPSVFYKWEDYGDLSRKDNFARLYAECGNSVVANLEKLFPGAGVKRITLDEWYGQCVAFDAKSIIEALYRMHVKLYRPSTERRRIWGDKTPPNIKHIPILNTFFPDARYVFLMRDPRDAALSMDKFSYRHYFEKTDAYFTAIWSAMQADGLNKRIIPHTKSICHTMAEAKKNFDQLHCNYITVRYESILLQLDDVLKRVAEFLGVRNFFDLSQFQTPEQSYGEGSGSKAIVKDNYQKYKKVLSPSIVAEIQKYCGSELYNLGYSKTSRDSAFLNPMLRKYFSLRTVVSFFIKTVQVKGWSPALMFLYKRIMGKKIPRTE